MRKITILMILIWLILLIHCSHKEQSYLEETILKEKTSFIDLQWCKEKGIDVSDYSQANLYLDDDSVNLYGYSLKQNTQKIVKTYDRDLNLKSEKEFNIGQGPGDLGPGAHLYPIANHIYVADNTQGRINIFDKKMNFIKFVKTPFSYKNTIFTPDGKYFIATQFMFYEARRILNHISIFSFPELEKNRIHTMGPCRMRDEKDMVLRGECPEFYYFLKNEKIYLINMKTYQIMTFDLSGKILKRVRVQVEKIPVPTEKRKVWLKGQTHPRLIDRSKFADFVQPASWMIPLGKGFVVIRRTGYGTSCEGLVDGDYFNYDLQLLGKVKFPCFHFIYTLLDGYFHRVFAYDNGYVYLLTQDLQETDEDINLEKWRVIE